MKGIFLCIMWLHTDKNFVIIWKQVVTWKNVGYMNLIFLFVD